jgi:nanoRNase/pAp phosphatase (c-di-AMP/oligoRNAs hydrolase)
MELQETKNLINDSKNIYLVSAQDPEAMTSSLALFYTLRNLNKNVNLLADDLPENLKFLTPSLDFISYPKNFVISVPNNIAQVSQIYYEKTNNELKIHLTVESGNIKKDNISFYFAEAKPDLIITVGVKDYSKELSNNLNSFGFLLDSPILNIDNGQTDNKKFGKINIIENCSLPEIIFNLIKNINPEPIKKELAECLLCATVLHTKNFKNGLTAEIFQTVSELMKNGADLKKITDNLKL